MAILNLEARSTTLKYWAADENGVERVVGIVVLSSREVTPTTLRNHAQTRSACLCGGRAPEPALIACDQIIGLARLGQGQKIIVRWIGRARHARQWIDAFGMLLNLVDQAAGFMRSDEFGHTRLLEPGPQLVDMRCAGQERKFSVQPGVDDSGGLAGRGDRADTMMLVSRTTRIRL